MENNHDLLRFDFWAIVIVFLYRKPIKGIRDNVSICGGYWIRYSMKNQAKLNWKRANSLKGN